jgi:predicted AlkP superfamily pyrophosphatase or phosphodiesterase
MAARQAAPAPVVTLRRATVLLVTLAALAPSALWAQAPTAPAPPKLVVFVSVDQLRFDYLTRFDSLFKGGFRTLLDRGAVFTNARYRHANTETGPGHAVLLSGRNASHSGIIANEWYDPLTRAMVNVVDDPAQVALLGTGRGASPANFDGFTVGDLLKRRSPLSRVVTLSMKDRSAVLMGGRRGDAAYWYDATSGSFTSSTYYMNALPPWLTAWNSERQADLLFGRHWIRLLPDEAEYQKRAGADAIAGEWDSVDNVFPHVTRGKAKEASFYDGLRRTPYADDLLLSVALRALEAHELGQRGVTDLMAIGFSAFDSIGHTYGPDSQEAMDELLRLDLVLGKLVDALDARVGRGQVLFALSADHGSMPLVEVLQKRGEEAWRVGPDVFSSAVAKALAARFPGATGLVAKMDAPHVYLDLPALQRQGLKRAAVEAVVAEGLMSTGLLERTYVHGDLAGDPPKDDAVFPLFRNSFYAPRSPHVIGRLKRYVYVTSEKGGTGHGTHHDHDRHVPILFMGPRVAPGRYETPCGPEDIAPTLGRLLGLDYPLQDAERVLTEMILN